MNGKEKRYQRLKLLVNYDVKEQKKPTLHEAAAGLSPGLVPECRPVAAHQTEMQSVSVWAVALSPAGDKNIRTVPFRDRWTDLHLSTFAAPNLLTPDKQTGIVESHCVVCILRAKVVP